MLSHAVVDAVAQGRFHIYSADHASEGAALLMNTPFETVLSLSQRVLQTYRQLCQATLAHGLTPTASAP
jgi:hypothetical protein